jgi:PAS domain S-box-containing protein
MKNLLNSTDIATLFLDNELRVRRFTPQAAKIIKLIASDIGRHFTDITTTLDYPELADDACSVLRTLIFKEKMVTASGNRWFSVRIMPYSTLDNVIDGLVLTFTDASVSKALEVALRKEEAELRKLADSLPQLVFCSRADGTFDYLSRQWFDFTGAGEAAHLGDGWLGQVHRDDSDRVRAEWLAAIQSGVTFDSQFRLRRADGVHRWFKTRAVPIRDVQGSVLKWYGTCTDIDDLWSADEARRRGAESAMSILESINDAVLSLDEWLLITFINPAAARLFELDQVAALGRPLVDVLTKSQVPIFNETCRQVLRDKATSTFDAHFDAVPYDGWYRVRAYPQRLGISVILRRRESALVIDETLTKGSAT